MKIIVQQRNLKDINELMNSIYTDHWQKINRVKKGTCEIEFINGDKIRFISTEDCRHTDGLSFDVAIGPNAHNYTRYSNYDKNIWDFIDLDNYLKNIQGRELGIDLSNQPDYTSFINTFNGTEIKILGTTLMINVQQSSGKQGV